MRDLNWIRQFLVYVDHFKIVAEYAIRSEAQNTHP